MFGAFTLVPKIHLGHTALNLRKQEKTLKSGIQAKSLACVSHEIVIQMHCVTQKGKKKRPKTPLF
jgi:hypothetical protein